MSRWHKERHPPPGEQSFEAEAYKIKVIEPGADLADAAQQLRHAQEQIAIAEQYPGRSLPAAPRAEVIELRPRR
jgi:hypothetical protein